MGLGAFQTGAFTDSTIEAAIGIDGVDEFVMYAAGAGHPRPGLTDTRSSLRLSEHLPDGAAVEVPVIVSGPAAVAAFVERERR